jgi:predicted component of type VI protein secretion system
MPYLEFETPDGGRRVALDRERLSIGRLSHNDVALPYGHISRQHAEVRRIDGHWWIVDLHSTNGLRINARRLQEHALASGDRVVLAPDISFRFVDEVESASPGAGQPASSSLPNDGAWTWADRVAQQDAPWEHEKPFAAGRPPSAQEGRPVFRRGDPPPPPPLRWPTGPGAAGASNGTAAARPDDHPTQVPEPGSYPFPPRAPYGDAGMADLYRRDGPQSERGTAARADSTLLHVCQTCGQLTAANAVYCQNCHHSIAQECPNCRLSLLPIQERCPRCHTPNPTSVRRAHPRRTSY